MDKYVNYDQLRHKETEGEDYQIYLRETDSDAAVIAPHGGGIEPGTLEIADAVAGAEHGFYAFEGIKRKGNSALHITSENFDEPSGLKLLRKSKAVLALHGCTGKEEVVCLGGRDEHLKARIKEQLEESGFMVRESANPNLQGMRSLNICNRGQTKQGVQLELTHALRRKMFASLKRSGRKNKTELFQNFVSSLRVALSATESEGN